MAQNAGVAAGKLGQPDIVGGIADTQLAAVLDDAGLQEIEGLVS